MRDVFVPHNKPSIDPRDIASISRTLRSGWIAQGTATAQFERAICRRLGASPGEAVAVSSGTAATYLALQALDVGARDEVILPTYVCSALLNAVYFTGARPVLADVRESDFNISSEQVRKKLSRKTKAVIVPHIYGVPADMDELLKLGVPLIEDCAQAIGATYKRQPVGTFGTLAVFSFYATKMLTSGQGGMVFSRHKALVDKIRDFREFDCRRSYKKRFNFQMTDIQAALGLSQLARLPSFIRKRRDTASRYLKILPQKKSMTGQSVGPDKTSVYYRFAVRASKACDPIIAHFDRFGVETIAPLEAYELLHRYLKEDPREYPVAENLARTVVSLPVYPALTEKQIRRVESALRKLKG